MGIAFKGYRYASCSKFLDVTYLARSLIQTLFNVARKILHILQLEYELTLSSSLGWKPVGYGIAVSVLSHRLRSSVRLVRYIRHVGSPANVIQESLRVSAPSCVGKPQKQSKGLVFCKQRRESVTQVVQSDLVVQFGAVQVYCMTGPVVGERSHIVRERVLEIHAWETHFMYLLPQPCAQRPGSAYWMTMRPESWDSVSATSQVCEIYFVHACRIMSCEMPCAFSS